MSFLLFFCLLFCPCKLQFRLLFLQSMLLSASSGVRWPLFVAYRHSVPRWGIDMFVFMYIHKHKHAAGPAGKQNNTQRGHVMPFLTVDISVSPNIILGPLLSLHGWALTILLCSLHHAQQSSAPDAHTQTHANAHTCTHTQVIIRKYVTSTTWKTEKNMCVFAPRVVGVFLQVAAGLMVQSIKIYTSPCYKNELWSSRFH